MCYLARQQQPEAMPSGVGSRPGSEVLRPRWIGAAALTLLGGLTVAAAVGLAPPAPQSPQARDAGAPLPVATTSPALPTGGAMERTALPADDGVPTGTEVSKAGAGNCHHGL